MKKQTIAFIDSLDNEIGVAIYGHLCSVVNAETKLIHVKANGELPSAENTKEWLVEKGFDGIIFSGSTFSVNDDIDWIKNQCSFTEQIIKNDSINVPCLGLCFGHQMLVKAAGVDVGYVDTTINGIKVYDVVAEDELFQGVPKNFSTFVYHNNIVNATPEEFEPIIGDIDGIVQGFKHKTKLIYGLQSHPEAPYEIVKLFNDQITQEQFPTESGNKIIKNFSDLVANYEVA